MCEKTGYSDLQNRKRTNGSVGFVEGWGSILQFHPGAGDSCLLSCFSSVVSGFCFTFSSGYSYQKAITFDAHREP